MSIFSGCPPGSDSVVQLVLGDKRSTHCVVPKGKGKSDSDFVEQIFSSFGILLLVLSLLSIGAHILTKCLRYRYLKQYGSKSPSISINNATGGGAATAVELTPLMPDDSVLRDATTENFLNEIGREKHRRFTLQQLELYTQHMSIQLGAGGSGAVYKGMLPSSGLNIAVKLLDPDKKQSDEITMQQFMAEVGTLWWTNHANVIRLIGYCYDGRMHALVYEFMANGSLDKYLFDSRRVAASSELLALAVGVARGLRYLHEECQKKFIHYDVKASNVLLDDNLSPKLTDFGITQLLSRADAHASVHAVSGTVGYMAPEVVDVETAAITEKCDVYSFGILLFEIICRRRQMDNSLPETDKWLPLLAWTMYEQGKLLDLMKKCHNPMAAADEERWKETAERMCKVAFLCVQDQPKSRPTMSMVVNMLEGHLEIPPPVYPFGGCIYETQEKASGTTASCSTATTSEVTVRIDPR